MEGDHESDFVGHFSSSGHKESDIEKRDIIMGEMIIKVERLSKI